VLNETRDDGRIDGRSPMIETDPEVRLCIFLLFSQTVLRLLFLAYLLRFFGEETERKLGGWSSRLRGVMIPGQARVG
jgi:hypothetical protein